MWEWKCAQVPEILPVQPRGADSGLTQAYRVWVRAWEAAQNSPRCITENLKKNRDNIIFGALSRIGVTASNKGWQLLYAWCFKHWRFHLNQFFLIRRPVKQSRYINCQTFEGPVCSMAYLIWGVHHELTRYTAEALLLVVRKHAVPSCKEGVQVRYWATCKQEDQSWIHTSTQ